MRRPSPVVLLLTLVIAMIVALLVGGLTWMASTINTQADEGRERQASLDTLVAQYADLYADAQAAGAVVTTPTPQNAAEAIPGPVSIPARDGRDGKDGVDGINGLDSVIPGKDGLNGVGTDGKDGADGASVTGADGGVGATGAQGRSLTALTCVDTDTGSDWVVTFTDPADDTTTTATIPGPCRVAPIIPPVVPVTP